MKLIPTLGVATAIATLAITASAQDLTGTLKKVKETGTITIGHRESSIPFSYLDDKQQPIGYAMDLCAKIVDAVKAELKMPGLKVVEEEKVPETVAVEKSMGSMINLDGATLLFPTSFGYFDPHMLKEAAKFSKIQFRHCGGLWTEGKHPLNTGSYFGYIDEEQYLSGIVAGSVSKSGKLGFVAAKPIPQVLRNINAFTLGAQ